MQFRVCEVPDALDPTRYQLFRDGVRHILGNGQNSHTDRILSQIFLQLIHRIYRCSCNFPSYQFRICIKSSGKMKTAKIKPEVFNQSPAQISGPHDDRRMHLGHSKDICHLITEICYIIPIPLLSKLSKTGQVLPDLRGCQIHSLSQRTGGDPDHTTLRQVAQMSIVAG